MGGSYREECLVTSTSSEPSTSREYTTTFSGTQNTSNVNYITAASVLIGMHIFTLIVWVHLRI